MELLRDKAFEALFRGFAREAFHLEVQDAYHTPDEAGPFQLFLDGKPDDPSGCGAAGSGSYRHGSAH